MLKGHVNTTLWKDWNCKTEKIKTGLLELELMLKCIHLAYTVEGIENAMKPWAIYAYLLRRV